MIYKQLSYLPIIFQVDEGIFLEIEDFLHRNKLFFTKILVVSGKSSSYEHAARLIEKTKWEHYILENNTKKDVNKLKSYCGAHHFDLVLAIGGGKVLDTVKRVSYLTNINHLSIPTIISNDGLISPIAVIKNKKGKTKSLPGMMPMGVVIDLDIIKNSPVKYIRAAAGDILSNLSATNDWILAYKQNKDSMNDLGFHLSKSAANALVHFNGIDLNSKAFLRLVVQGQINSGIAMSLAGTSRPCSGSEHLISHALDAMDLTNHVLHGTQVATISLFTLFLQDKLMDFHIHYAIETGIPLCFTEFLDDADSQTLKKIFHKSKKMRPGRYTILDRITEDEFVQKIEEFNRFIEQYRASHHLAS